MPSRWRASAIPPPWRAGWDGSAHKGICGRLWSLIGAGSIGQAIARRVSAGRHVLIADLRPDAAEQTAQTLREAGFTVTAVQVDIASCASVEGLRRGQRRWVR